MSGDFVLILKKRDMIIHAFKSGSFGVPMEFFCHLFLMLLGVFILT